MGPRPHGFTIERDDRLGDYCPLNSRWAGRDVQSRNRRTVRMVEFQGRTMSIPQWADNIGISYFSLLARFKRGWSVEKALTTPV
jgi:hypothetical protein